MTDPLMASLLDLLYELRAADVPLIIGGGFGLYLKRLHFKETEERTLLNRIPETRSTNDIDLFLRVEIVADLARMKAFADALNRIGYKPIDTAQFFQWKREIKIAGVAQEIKLDLLMGPPGQFEKQLRIKRPRVRPKGEIQLHAYLSEEAVEIENDPIPIIVEGRRFGGDSHRATVLVPQAFSYLMMKLHAFDDRKDDDRKDLGRHHALDLYTIVALMTEAEYENAVSLGEVHRQDPHVQRAHRIVADSFADSSSIGNLRLREHPLYRDEFDLTTFIDVLVEVFGR